MADDLTPLDAAYLAMIEQPGDPAARLRFFERVLDAELFVLLEAEAEPDRLRPRVFALDAGRFAPAFDRDARLAAFLDAPAPYAALSGRRLVTALAGQGIGLALNPGAAPSESLLSSEELDWLADMAAGPADPPAQARVRDSRRPRTPRRA